MGRRSRDRSRSRRRRRSRSRRRSPSREGPKFGFYFRAEEVGLVVGSGGAALKRLNHDIAPHQVVVGADKDADPSRASHERSLQVLAPSEEAACRVVRNYLSTLSYVRSSVGELVHTSKALAVGAVRTTERFTPPELQKIERATGVTLEVGGESGGARILHVRGRMADVAAACAKLRGDERERNGSAPNAALYDVAPHSDGLALRVPPWAMSRIALPETRKLVERSTRTALQLKKTKEGDGKIVISGSRDECEGAKDRILQAIGLEEWAFGAPSCRARVELRDAELAALVRAEREVTEIVEVAGRALALAGLKGAMASLQELTQTSLVAKSQAEADPRRGVAITGLPEDVSDAAGRLRFIAEEMGRLEREGKGKGKGER